ncbi:MAG: hypothetical protein DRJ26_01465 [Candidatus Methanomethylicota archaeon]|uniref:Exosome protein n=1 Tax=Thermoproteota archaeon TaxID=2056631 RepID=A0A497EXR3_9CREN|nr:MAG: hypothetical protein DRJ20_01060 [Candidatus Verstraetearchaeota archaeon]RLE54815.1 MAG: hypothetical protein DRJ26_01465 [Candidatus Verstraetearchaeota archaeon]
MPHREAPPISEIKIEAFSHATEDPDKVKNAMLAVLPSHLRESVKFSKEVLRGYYGNPVVVMRITIRDKGMIRDVVEHIASKLDSLDKKLLESTFDLRTFKAKTFYMRFSKDEAYRGNLVLTNCGEVIKVSLSFTSIKNKRKLMKVCRELGLLKSEG